MTIANQWSWKPEDEVKSLEQCLHTLIRSAGGDGNLLFNVGPMPDGRIEPLQVERLKEMGMWLKKYGYTIYETRGGPFKPNNWGVSTRKGNKVYIHLLNWKDESPEIRIPEMGIKINECRLVDGGEITINKQDGGYLIKFSKDDLQPINTIIELAIEDDVMSLMPMEFLSH